MSDLIYLRDLLMLRPDVDIAAVLANPKMKNTWKSLANTPQLFEQIQENPEVFERVLRSVEAEGALEELKHSSLTGHSYDLMQDLVANPNYQTPHWNLINDELMEYGTNEYVRDADGRILTFGAYEQLCPWSEEPDCWDANNDNITTELTPDENIGPFKALNVIGGTDYWQGIKLVNSFYANEGDKFFKRVYFRYGNADSFDDNSFLSVGNEYAIRHDTIRKHGESVNDYAHYHNNIYRDAGYKLSEGEFNKLERWWTIKELNGLPALITMAFTPNMSEPTDNVIVLGGDVFNTDTWRPHVPSSGSAVSVSATHAAVSGGNNIGPVIPLDEDIFARDEGEIEWRGRFLFDNRDIHPPLRVFLFGSTINKQGPALYNVPGTPRTDVYYLSQKARDVNGDVFWLVISNLDVVYGADTSIILQWGFPGGCSQKKMRLKWRQGDVAKESNIASIQSIEAFDGFLGLGYQTSYPVAHEKLIYRRMARW